MDSGVFYRFVPEGRKEVEARSKRKDESKDRTEVKKEWEKAKGGRREGSEGKKKRKRRKEAKDKSKGR